MSYCVNCGVKLSPQEKKCPLCNTAVINPSTTSEQNNFSLYPEHLDHIPSNAINRRYLSELIACITLFAGATSVICDLLIVGAITWSIYVIGATGFIMCLLAALRTHFKLPYEYIAITVCSTLLYLLFIAFLNGGLTWYLYLAMPLLILTGSYSTLCTALMRSNKKNRFRSIGYCFLFLVLALILMEILTDLYLTKSISLFWSLCASIPTGVISLFSFGVSTNKKIMGEIKKRLFI